MAQVIFKNVGKSFDKTEVIHNISLELPNNQFTVFVGPSGCGKSTLLRLIAGLEDITEGSLFIDGVDVTTLPPAKRGVAMVFQSYALYPHMTVYENIAFGLRCTKYARDEIDRRVLQASEILQLNHLLERQPKQLSGGQRQRVAIGRAIVRDPKVFLFDEPLSNLDASLRVKMRMQIAKLKNDLKTTMIYVTHDQTEAMTLADQIVVLNDGGVEQVGAPMALYHHPRNKFVASFIGSPKMNFVEGRIASLSQNTAVLELPHDKSITLPVSLPNGLALEKDDSVELGVRPEHVFVVPEDKDGLFTGGVTLIENLGSEIYAYVKIGWGQTILVRLGGESRVKVGDRLALSANPKDCHLFDTKGGLSFERPPAEHD
jgi:ABC-type sugar transport system ATPase subunit